MKNEALMRGIILLPDYVIQAGMQDLLENSSIGGREIRGQAWNDSSGFVFSDLQVLTG